MLWRGAGRGLTLAGLALLLPLSAQAAEHNLLSLDRTLLLSLMLLFVVLIYPVNELLFKPIFRVLDERAERIAGTRARAAQLERDAEAALTRYEASVQSVRTEAEQERRSLLDSARSEALAVTGEARVRVEREIEAARGEIAASLATARETLRVESRELAREAASRVLGRAL